MYYIHRPSQRHIWPCIQTANICESKTPLMAIHSYRGVEYEFENTQIEFLEELKCPICMELVFTPVQTSCGHLFCGKCIEGTNTCPIDRSQFTFHPDNFNDRRIQNFKVKCPHKERGCQWHGNLGDAEKHANRDCDHQMVKCKRCDMKMEKQQWAEHTLKECCQRMNKCPHCSEEGMKSETITIHFTKCKELPLPCPTGCGKPGLVRRNIADHLSADCPDELVPCTFAIAGCQQIVKRKDLQQHLQDKDVHLEAVLLSHVSLTLLVQDLLYGSTPNIPLPLRRWLQNTPTCYPRPPWVIKMVEFEKKEGENEAWFSDPVHSHFGGYKMCLRVDANGRGDAKGTHVSAYIFLLRGDNDDNLKWPFKGTIKVSLLNQLEDGQHHTMRLWPPDCDIPKDASGRVTEGERAVSGFGKPQFISHQDLSYPADKKCQYLKDNTLFFRVDCFEPKLD